jgi:hypothetical protein
MILTFSDKMEPPKMVDTIIKYVSRFLKSFCPRLDSKLTKSANNMVWGDFFCKNPICIIFNAKFNAAFELAKKYKKFATKKLQAENFCKQ